MWRPRVLLLVVLGVAAQCGGSLDPRTCPTLDDGPVACPFCGEPLRGPQAAALLGDWCGTGDLPELPAGTTTGDTGEPDHVHDSSGPFWDTDT